MFSIVKNIKIVRNMGLRYTGFRVVFELEKKLGLFKKKFPQDPPEKEFIKLEKWRENNWFWGKILKDNVPENISCSPDVDKLIKGEIPFFSGRLISLGIDYDWITNPDTGYRYDATQHWSEVRDYDKNAGDIKFVWEKSRFSYLYDIMRYDLFRNEDHSAWVFNEIASWLDANKINSGPNYKCSQEISLRVLNWTYALNFYKHSVHLTEDLFQKIIHAIYWQLKHVYANINFSRIAVRNNHAITETLTLYLGALFYPFFPEAIRWKKDGKRWFEQEIAYQVYPDGTFLQFSMNYHRVVIQLFTWALKTADFFSEKYSDLVYDRAYKSLRFLFTCQDMYTGWLPNYGSNDGALFFKLNSCDYRDYRPQLTVLHILLTGEPLYEHGDWNEDIFWFQANELKACNFPVLRRNEGWEIFEKGGYFVLREPETLTFIRCGNHKDRPAQADNLHLDIWYKGENILFDGGSYKYNTDFKTLKYFMGTESHNTVMLDNYDQMLKGERFIWYNWTQQAQKVSAKEDDHSYYFEGAIFGFRELHPGIIHVRKLIKRKGQPKWIIEDEISGKPTGIKIRQLWHVLPRVTIQSKDNEGKEVSLCKEFGMRSDYYSIKNKVDQFAAETTGNTIITTISLA